MNNVLEDFLKETAMRWISQSRLVIKNTIEDEDLESQMDFFIDTNLWFLPIPRFSRTCEKVEPEKLEETIELGCKKAQSFFTSPKTCKGIYECQTFFNKYYPHIFILRDTSVDNESLALILALMALDPELLSGFPLTFYRASNFIANAYEAIKKDIVFPFDNNALDMLLSVTKHLNLNNKDTTSYSTWKSYLEIKCLGLLSNQLELMVKNTLEKDSAYFEKSEEFLMRHMHLSSIAEESPDVAYNINSVWVPSIV